MLKFAAAAVVAGLFTITPAFADEMMKWVIDQAEQRKGDDLYLSVFVDNHRARKFYERWGFVAEGSYAFMVGTHADEDIVMRRPL